MTHITDEAGEYARFKTGVKGLDILLGGGLLESGLYLIEGMPGAGKTILGNQICFNVVKRGGRALFVTLLAESHGKMIRHIRAMSFFDESAIGNSYNIISSYSDLKSKDAKGIIEKFASSIREYRPTVMVIDGFRVVREFLENDAVFTKFVHELNSLITGFKCTTLLLSPIRGNQPKSEYTLVDGLIELNRANIGMRSVREIEIHKLRGSDHLQGRHKFRITNEGLQFFPRAEALYNNIPLEGKKHYERLSFGIPSLDRMLHGGLISGSTTMFLGAPGSGKTLTGLKFLEAGANNGEASLYFGFYEPTEKLISKAQQVGINLSGSIKSGSLEIIWQAPLELLMDQLFEQLIEAVKRRKVRRLFIDDIDGFINSTYCRDRFTLFVTALSNVLRANDVTTIFTAEIPLFSFEIRSETLDITAMIENIVIFRFVELAAKLRRLISIVKTRESSHDTGLREFVISDQGIEVMDTFQSAEELLSGIGHIIGPDMTLSGEEEFQPRNRKRSK